MADIAASMPTPTTELKTLGRGRFSLCGRADVSNARHLLGDGRKQFVGFEKIRVDLELADCCNSVGLALLVEWFTWCQSREIELTYEKPHADLLEFVKLNNVEEVLKFLQ